jgi:hypothetical protein
VKEYRGGDGPDADADDLPLTWQADDPDRPCDRCPADGASVFFHGGVERCLCADCYRRVVLGR